MLTRLRAGGLCTLLVLSGASVVSAASDRPFPDRRPADRTQALELIASHPADDGLASRIRQRLAAQGPVLEVAPPTEAQAVALLAAAPSLPAEQEWWPLDSIRVRYTVAQGSPDRVDPTDGNGNAVPDAVEAVGQGIEQARRLLHDEMGLRAPARTEIVAAGLAGTTTGYHVQMRDAVAGSARPGWLVVLDAAPRGGTDAIRRAALRHYTRVVASDLSERFPEVWGEALATWAEISIDGLVSREVTEALSQKLAHAGSGLFGSAPTTARGNAIWLAFLQEAYGIGAVRSAIQELAADTAPPVSFDRALRRMGADLARGLREFHLWSLLVGPRSDGAHFSFAGQLTPPPFASSNHGLPALSVQADAPVAIWGAAQVRFDLAGLDGGFKLHFEGEYPVRRWEADLVLRSLTGETRRLSLDLSPEGRGEIAVPLDGLAEAWLLVRHLGGPVNVEGQPKRYTYTAHRESQYPMDLVALDAVEDGGGDGVVVTWETASEQDVIGFDVLRRREDGELETTLNPLWIPALGDGGRATSYVYIDQSAEPGEVYVYRVQAITRAGLLARSEPVVVRPASP